jgi:hypothetical protein
MQGAHTTVRDGIRMSTPIQAFLDLASAGASLVDLVIAGDSLVKANDLDPALFIVGAAVFHGRNASHARRAASLVRAGVDSPMETRIRLLIVLAGLPEPQVNFIVRLANGKWRWRFDLCYPEYKLIIEYDGRHHAYNDEQWSRDLERREWLDQDGWRIVIVVSEGIYEIRCGPCSESGRLWRSEEPECRIFQAGVDAAFHGPLLDRGLHSWLVRRNARIGA